MKFIKKYKKINNISKYYKAKGAKALQVGGVVIKD